MAITYENLKNFSAEIQITIKSVLYLLDHGEIRWENEELNMNKDYLFTIITILYRNPEIKAFINKISPNKTLSLESILEPYYSLFVSKSYFDVSYSLDDNNEPLMRKYKVMINRIFFVENNKESFKNLTPEGVLLNVFKQLLIAERRSLNAVRAHIFGVDTKFLEQIIIKLEEREKEVIVKQEEKRLEEERQLEQTNQKKLNVLKEQEEKKKRYNEESNEFYSNLPFETISFIEKLSKFYQFLKQEYKNFADKNSGIIIENDFAALSIIHESFMKGHYESLNLDYYFGDVIIIQFFSIDFMEFIENEFDADIDIIKNIFGKYIFEGQNKGLIPEQIRPINIINNLFDRNFTGSIIFERWLVSNSLNYNGLRDSINRAILKTNGLIPRNLELAKLDDYVVKPISITQISNVLSYGDSLMIFSNVIADKITLISQTGTVSSTEETFKRIVDIVYSNTGEVKKVKGGIFGLFKNNNAVVEQHEQKRSIDISKINIAGLKEIGAHLIDLESKLKAEIASYSDLLQYCAKYNILLRKDEAEVINLKNIQEERKVELANTTGDETELSLLLDGLEMDLNKINTKLNMFFDNKAVSMIHYNTIKEMISRHLLMLIQINVTINAVLPKVYIEYAIVKGLETRREALLTINLVMDLLNAFRETKLELMEEYSNEAISKDPSLQNILISGIEGTKAELEKISKIRSLKQ